MAEKQKYNLFFINKRNENSTNDDKFLINLDFFYIFTANHFWKKKNVKSKIKKKNVWKQKR